MGVEIYDGKDRVTCIPPHDFPALILNMVKVLKETKKTVDDHDGGV